MATTVYGDQISIASGVKTRIKYVYDTTTTNDSYRVSGTLYYGDSTIDGGSEYVSRNFTQCSFFADGTRFAYRDTYVASETAAWSFSRGTTASTHTLTLSAFWRYGNGNDTSNTRIELSLSVPALPTYTVSYNANGGSGAPSSQTKTHGVTLKLSSTVPTLSGYTFMGWATSSANASAGTVAYAAGANYTANAAATLYAVWRRTITFNANGGGGAPSSQTGYKGTNTTLSSTVPTWTGYTFLGWNTASNGSGTHYSPSGAYSGVTTTLYAMWRRIVISVDVGSNRRSDTTCSFSATWTCQGTVGGSVTTSAKYSDTDSTPTTTLTLTGTTTGTKVAGTTLSGTVSGSFTCPEGTVGRALVTVTFTDTYTTSYSGTHTATAQLSVTIAKAFRLLTGKHGTNYTDADGDTYQEGIAIGLLASLIGRFEVGLTTIFRKAVQMDKALTASSTISAAGNISITSKSKGYYLKDSTGTAYAGVYDNGSNLWIGSTQTSATHHRGGTYISAGHNGTSGNSTIYVSVPNAANDGGTNYGVYHAGNKPSYSDLGTVPIANGGTGATTVAAARNALGLGNTSGAVPIANGGTGATTVAAARTNLGITPANIGALATTGGTLTGGLINSGGSYYKDTSNIDCNGTLPSSTVWGGGFYQRDNDGFTIHEMDVYEDTSGTIWGRRVVQNKKSSDSTTAAATISIGVKRDGTVAYSVTSPVNFRSAIGALGDVIAGAKTVSLPANSSSISVTAPTVSGYTFVCWLQVAGSGHTNPGYMQDPRQETTNLWSAVGSTTDARSWLCTALYKTS